MFFDIVHQPQLMDEDADHAVNNPLNLAAGVTVSDAVRTSVSNPHENAASRTLWMDGYNERVYNAVVLQIWASIVACFLSLSLILAIVLPLFRKQKRNRASTYNLYLVFLAIPDLVYNGFLVYLFATFDKWTEPPGPDDTKFPLIDHSIDNALLAGCGAASLYTNAIIAHEILRLLRNSKQRRRCKSPNLRTATMQAGCTYTLGLAIFMLDHYLFDIIYAESTEWVEHFIIWPFNLTVTILLPIFYLLWVSFRILREGLFFGASFRAGKRLTILVRYFSRLILIYVGLWVPIAVLYMRKFDSSANPGLNHYLACCIYALQVFASFALSMTKPDIRMSIVSLFNCYQNRPERSSTMSSQISGASKSAKPCGADPCGSMKRSCDDEDPDSATATVLECEDGGAGSKAIEINDNIFDFAGADAPTEIDFCEIPRRYRFFLHRHNSMSDDEDGGHLSDCPIVSSRRISSTLTETTQSNNGTMSEPLSLRSSATSSNFSRKFSQSMRRSLASPTRSPTEITKRSHTDQYESCRPIQPMRRISSGKESKFEDNSATFTTEKRLKITNYRLGMQNDFSKHNKIIQESMRDETISSRDLDLDETMVDSFFLDSTPGGPRDCDSDGERRDNRRYQMTPKQHRRWIKDLRRNIRALTRQLKDNRTSDEQKRVCRQSLYHQKMALAMATSSFGANGSSREQTHKSLSSDSHNTETIWSQSHNADTIWSESHNAETICTDVPPDDNGSSSSSSSDDASASIGASASSSDDSAMKPATNSWGKKKRWISELRQSIFDLQIWLDQGECTEAEQIVLQRSIESQKTTLSSLRAIDNSQYETIRLGGGNGDAGGASGVIRKNSDHRSGNSNNNNNGGGGKACLKVPLEAIIDTSENFRSGSENRVYREALKGGEVSDYDYDDITWRLRDAGEDDRDLSWRRAA